MKKTPQAAVCFKNNYWYNWKI